MKKYALASLPLGLLLLAGCNKSSVSAASDPNAANTAVTQPVPTVTLPAGTNFRVRLLETLDTRSNRAGDQFTAALDEPLVDGDRVIVPKGTTFTGHIVQSSASGRFKGRAVMALTLDTFSLNGQVYEVSSNNSSRASKGHAKHNTLWIGGSAGGGAIIGAAAAGGPGALIGAGAGAAAGTIGSAVTGKREIRLPVETELRFTLDNDVAVNS